MPESGCNTQPWLDVSAAGTGQTGPVVRMEMWIIDSNGATSKIANFSGDTFVTHPIFFDANYTLELWEIDSNGHALKAEARVDVLGREGGAFPPWARLTRCFLGGAVGCGRQYVSWLQLTDAVRMYRDTIDREDFQGAYVAASPQPARPSTTPGRNSESSVWSRACGKMVSDLPRP